MQQELISLSNVPDLSKAVPAVIELGCQYWTPEEQGESKRGFILGIEMQTHERQADKEGEESSDIQLPCIVFAEQTKEGFTRWANGSKRLVAVIDDAIKGSSVKVGETPLQITYLGKRKNKTNQFRSDSWEVKPLVFESNEESQADSEK